MPQTRKSVSKPVPRWIVYTDLDGTLLDLHSYSFAESLAGVNALRRLEVPVIFTSSKTFTEQRHLQQQIGIDEPFIVENGSAVFIPQTYFDFSFPHTRRRDGYCVIELGIPASDIRRILHSIRDELSLSFTGFAEMPLQKLQKITGLDAARARDAQHRDYSETIIAELNAMDWQRFQEALQRKGLICQPGSRFYTITSSQADKGKAVKTLNALFKRAFGTIRTVGIGDSSNDLPLFQAVDEAYLVQRPDGRWASIPLESIHRIDAIGPRGWLKVAESIVRRIHHSPH